MVIADACEFDFDVEFAGVAGDWGLLVNEVGEGEFEVGCFGVEAVFHFVDDAHDLVGAYALVVLVEHFEEAAHVGAFLVMREANVHVDVGDGGLGAACFWAFECDGVADIFDANFVDGDLAIIFAALNVGHTFLDNSGVVAGHVVYLCVMLCRRLSAVAVH